MGCLGECWDMGPPPDSILNLPPPPIPVFFQHTVPDVVLNTTPCSSTQLCDSFPAFNRISEKGDYVEMPRKDVETWSVSEIDDTWLLVLVASSIGVLLLGALLAMFLLKCREMNMFDGNECSIHSRENRQTKSRDSRECSGVTNHNSSKLMPSSEPVMYQGGPSLQDNRMVWAALTPHGTQHFISENYPRNIIDYCENDNHYETVDNITSHPTLPSQTHYSYPKGLTLKLAPEKSSFDNSGFVDYDYEDPAPLIESYQLNDMENEEITQYTMLGNTDMRCASLGFPGNSLRRGVSIRPRVSSPTRIEHPNLPPLNLYPHKANTMKKNCMNYRNVENMGTLTLPKYGC